MSGFVTIPDRVPVETIAALTNAALRVYLERHGWRLGEKWQADGQQFVTYLRDGYQVDVAEDDSTPVSAAMMALNLNGLVNADNRRSADVIGELQTIAEWRKDPT